MSKENLEKMEYFLAEEGIARDKYVIIDANADNYVKPFGAPNDTAMKLDFLMEQERIEKYGLPFVHGYNNGTSSILFANGICVVSQSSDVSDLISKLSEGASKKLTPEASRALTGMGVPLSNWETLVAQDGSENAQTIEVTSMKDACEIERTLNEAKKDLKIRKGVSAKLEDMGLEEGTYTILTAKDSGLGIRAQTGDVVPFDLVSVTPNGDGDVAASYNGGVAAFYFAEGAYVLSATEEARKAVAEVKQKNKADVWVCAARQGDVFYSADGKLHESLNDSWNSALMADERRKEVLDMLKSTKNRQSVSEKLEEMGIEEGTYMMFSERDARGVVAKNEFGDKCPMSAVLDDGAYKTSEKGKDVLASYNAGVSAFYFAEGVYVISTSEKARLQAQQIEEKQGFIGVAIGKNDTFIDAKGNPLDELTTEWEGAKKTTHRNETKEKQEKAGLGFSQVLYDRGGYGNM